MSQRLIPCRQCGAKLGHTSDAGILHSAAIQFVDLDDGAVTMRCPACGHTFTMRARRVRLEGQG